MKLTIGTALAVTSLLVLASCGGGGGSSSPPVIEPDSPTTEPDPTPDPEPDPEPTPDPEPDPTPEPDPEPQPPTVRSILGGLLATADTVTDANTTDGEPFLWTVTVQPKPGTLALADMTRWDDDPFTALGARRGVERATIRDGSALDFAGWMEHSFFLVNVWNPVGSDPLHPSESTFSHAYSVGLSSGSSPASGSATWTGVMAGIDEHQGTAAFGNLLEGDAKVSIDDFSRPAVGIAFTNITDTTTGAGHPSIAWHDIPVHTGAFSTSGMTGRFYGPNHEEVGGIFLQDDISGAFGATRE